MASIDAVDMNKAMTSESYAAQLIRSNKLTASQRGKIVSQWGSDKVKFWESVDATEYVISDEKKQTARQKGKQTTADSVGYSGKKNYGAWKDAALPLAAGGVLFHKQIVQGAKYVAKGVKKLASKIAGKTTEKAATETTKQVAKAATKKVAGETTKQTLKNNASDIITVLLASAEVALYLATKPNKEQYEAIMKLFESEYPQGIDSLTQAQDSMKEATEENTELTDEAQKTNDDANDTIEEDKTKMDFYKAQYEALVMKANAAANGGEPLTADEKALLQKLAPLLLEIVADITDVNDETSDALNDLYDQIGEYQDRYDEGAETIAEVQGVTDYGAGFDETTKTMCYVEAAAQGLNGTFAGIAAAKMATYNLWGILTPFIIMGTAASAASLAKFMPEQLKMASDISNVIDKREEVQDLEEVTTEVYDEETENFAGNLEILEDQEIEIPEDLEVPSETVPTGDAAGAPATGGTDEGTGNPFVDTAFGDDDSDGTGATRGAANTPAAGGTNGGNETTPPEKDPAYVSKMGYGKDWTEVTEGNVSRNSDDDIVTKDGKVLLSGTYANAITKATGAKEGEAFSKSDIPKILQELLGDPFTVEMIKKVRAGKQLDSEYAAKILKTKSQENKGDGTVDNSKKATEIAKQVIDFYYPIFEQAATKGWIRG